MMNKSGNDVNKDNIVNKEKKRWPKKKRVFLTILCVLGALLLILGGKRLFVGRFAKDGAVSGDVARIETDYHTAMLDGEISKLEIAEHFAPDILAAVNVLISDGGKGDFLTAVDFDGDLACDNNWENMSEYPLNAVVYYSVQETQSHYFVGYYFYHPRDDAEIWLDRHENDMEGIMLTIRKTQGDFGEVEVMYTQGHGYVPFYYDNEAYSITEGSKHDGGLMFSDAHPVIYITPNGTLLEAGHSVESAADHSTYLYVGNSGVYYYYGGVSQQPATYNGDYAKNPCSYSLESVDSLWVYRNGPHGDGNIFAQYGAFRGENYGTNSANPPWGWRNKTDFGYGGSFLSDPAWTVSKAIDGIELSHEYVDNSYADWVVTVGEVKLLADLTGETGFYIDIVQDGWSLSNSSWYHSTLTAAGESEQVYFDGINTIYVAAWAGAGFDVQVKTDSGRVLNDTEVSLEWSVRRLY